MRKSLLVSGCLLVAALAFHCSGTKSGSNSPKTETRFEFGRSTTVESLRRVIANTLRKYNHDLQITETFIESEYRFIPPTEAEGLRGIRDVRYKISVTISARRNISAADARLHTEGRFETGVWERIDPDPELVEFVKNMQEEIKQELNRFLPQW